MKCNTFSESHAQADFNDDDGNNMYDKYHEDENDNNDNNNNDNDNKKILFFSKVSSVIHFRNHKLKPILMMTMARTTSANTSSGRVYFN